MPHWVPVHATLGTPSGYMAWLHVGVYGYMAGVKSAMGSKRGGRTAGIALEVNLSETIYPLAAF